VKAVCRLIQRRRLIPGRRLIPVRRLILVRRLIPVLSLVLLTACPGATTTATGPPGSSATGSPGSCTPAGCDLTVHVGNIAFQVACDPVAEALTDIDLPHHAGEPKIKAIAGIARLQGVAVFLNEPNGCGLWALGLAEGLSPETDAAVRGEARRGVERFGVTATPVPRAGP
jgi:hypothetical protein